MTSPAYDRCEIAAARNPVAPITNPSPMAPFGGAAETSAAGDGPDRPTLSLDWGRRYALWIRNVGLACCAVEFVAACVGRTDLGRLGVRPDPSDRRVANLLVVSGTVTDRMAASIRRLYDRLPEPRYVLSFGACANSGGPYWDSYSVTKGVDQLIPVDVYVPGCPPRPESLWEGIRRLQAALDAERGAAARAPSALALTAARVPPPPVTDR